MKFWWKLNFYNTTQRKQRVFFPAKLIKSLKLKGKLNISSRDSFFSPKSSNGLFWKFKYIQGIKFAFLTVAFPIGGGEYANSFMPEIIKYWNLRNRGHLQMAHTACTLCWLIVPRHFFSFAVGDSGYAKTGKIALVDTENSTFSVHIKDESNLLLFWFPGTWATRVVHDHKPYMKLFSFLLALWKDECVFWYNNPSGYDLERDQFAPCVVPNGLFRKLWPFAPCVKDLSCQSPSCWLGQGHSP